MGRSTMSKGLPRPSVMILLGICLLGIYGTQMKVAGSPVPGDDNAAFQRAEQEYNTAKNAAQDFFDRAKNTFSGKADESKGVKGLTTLELAGVIAGAVLLFFIIFCCIGFCLCECIKELICCICCCGCCRD